MTANYVSQSPSAHKTTHVTRDYMVSCATKLLLLKPGERLTMRAFSRDISTAIDVIEIVRKRIPLDVEVFRIGAQEIRTSNESTTFRSVIEIEVRRGFSLSLIHI